MLYKLRTVLIICAVILAAAIGVVCALVVGFKPTETNAYQPGESSGSSSVSSEIVSSEASSAAESSSSTE